MSFDPDSCNMKVFKEGTFLGVLDPTQWPKDKANELVQEVTKETGQEVDWHYAAGRPVVKALGDAEKVKEALYKRKVELHG